jgi:peptide chain release factor 1
MKTSMQSKLDQLTTRLAELNDLLSREDVTSNLDQYRKLTREHAELGPLVEHYALWRQASNDAVTAQDLLADAGMRDFAEEEIRAARERMEQLGAELQKMLLPKDPNDDRNIFLEIRAGTGGDESALFAGDLLRMYLRFAERNRWQVEMMSASESDLGGYKEVIVRIAGEAAYSKLKFESGGHRVQRVPATETQGRIHTSACTVAVLPKPDEIGRGHAQPGRAAHRHLPRQRRRRPAHQQDRQRRAHHAPTHRHRRRCQDDRSQHRNKAKAMKVLLARLKDKRAREQARADAATRKSLIGSGDRSDRIRTYNFPQGGSPTIASTSRCTASNRSWTATSTRCADPTAGNRIAG